MKISRLILFLFLMFLSANFVLPMEDVDRLTDQIAGLDVNDGYDSDSEDEENYQYNTDDHFTLPGNEFVALVFFRKLLAHDNEDLEEYV